MMWLTLLAGFGKKFGPWILIGLVALGVYSGAATIVKDWKKSLHDSAYDEGVTKERARQDEIAQRITNVLAPRLDAIDANTGKTLNQQSNKEKVYVDRIRTQIKNNPVYSQCVIDDGVLRDRNALRESLKTTLDSSAGSSIGSAGNTAAPID